MAKPVISEVGPRLQPWLQKTLAADSVAIVELRGVGAGNSAETLYADVDVTVAGRTTRKNLVVRLQNEGSDIFLDASLATPSRAMATMAAYPEIPVPRVVGIELERQPMGVPFMVMERAVGRTVSQQPNYNLKGWLAELPLEKQSLPWRGAMEALARIHAIPWREKFSFLDQPQRGAPGLEQYLSWVEDWYLWARGDRPHPTTDTVLAYLKANRPRDTGVSVLWGDSQPNNVLWNEGLEVTAILDWEMVTLGPPEVDVAWWIYFDDMFSRVMNVPRLPGLPDRETLIGCYEAVAGRKLGDLHYYDVLAGFRHAIVSMRSVDREILLGKIPADTKARTHSPIMVRLAEKIDAPAPEVSPDYLAYYKVKMGGERGT